MNPIEIFRSGTHTAMSGERLTFSESDLASAAAAYDPALHEAPLVVGHPKSDQPAYGWVAGLDFAEGRLSATPAQVDDAFAELVRAGRFKKVSAAFYKPGAVANPKPEGYYLRHVGFLGAQPPAVKGLKPAQFADGEDGVVVFGDFEDRVTARLFRSLRDWVLEKFGAEDADKALPGFDVDFVQEQAAKDEPGARAFAEPAPENKDDPKKEETDMEQRTLEQRAAELDGQAEELRTRETRFSERESEHAAAVAAFRQAQAEFAVERLIGEGRLPPAMKSSVAAFMAGLDDGSGTLAFGEDNKAKKLSPRAWFEAFLGALPEQIAFGEVSGADGAGGGETDPEKVAEEAIAYQEEMRLKGITVSADRAVRHILKGA